jgi:hypothetical protein
MKGGELEFTLSHQANKTWGRNPADFPHSKITDNPIVPVPFFDAGSNKFRDKLPISIRSIEPNDELYYSVNNANPEKTVLYKHAFTIDTTCTIAVFAKRSNPESKTVYEKFYKIPSDKTITILSKVSSMYTAGGPDALIDGIEGTINWRAGEWQSYFNQDFEAIIDLQKVKPIHYVAVHVLQDIGPWIMYPKEVIFYTSDDGKNFTEAAKVENTIAQSNGPAQTQTLGTNVDLQTRYIKVKAVNGGKLPSWHESAGNPSHIFIDEIIVK